MSWLTVAMILAVVIAVVLFTRRDRAGGGGTGPGPDAWVLSKLRQAGSDLNKAHPIEFFLYFPSSEAADRVAAKLESQGFTVKSGVNPKSKDQWSVAATKSLVPELAEMVRLRSTLGELAATEHGSYDGWGTEVVK
jgi:hypothetical protein